MQDAKGEGEFKIQPTPEAWAEAAQAGYAVRVGGKADAVGLKFRIQPKPESNAADCLL